MTDKMKETLRVGNLPGTPRQYFDRFVTRDWTELGSGKYDLTERVTSPERACCKELPAPEVTVSP